MRCECCNKNLNDFESTARHAITGKHLDTCRKCLGNLNIPVLGRPDLNPMELAPDDEVLPVDDMLFEDE